MFSISQAVKKSLDLTVKGVAEDAAHHVERPGRDFTRNTILNFENTTRAILSMGGQCLSKELYDFLKPLGRTVTTSAFVQQRAKVLPTAFETVFSEFNAKTRYLDTRRYRGYKLYAVDGSAVYCPFNRASDSFMDKQEFNMWHVSAMYDLLNHVYEDIIIEPRSAYNEPRACWKMAERNLAGEKCIVICDRGYGGLNLFEHLNRIDGVEFLIRVRDNLYKAFENLPAGDYDADFCTQVRTTQRKEDKETFKAGTAQYVPGPSQFGKAKSLVCWDFESPCDLKYRVVRFWITETRYETIVTSLPADKFPPAVIKELYNLRWGIETSFRELKYDLGLVNFHAKKDRSVLQEIYAHFIMYNFCERIAMHVVVANDCGNKWVYAVNHTMAVHICLDFFRNLSGVPPDVEAQIQKYILPIREGRSDRRKFNGKRAVFFIYRVA